ncbi:MAG: hypothetical protein VKN72_20605 [Nostocales cyanobacterium 94392]|nr:hypothetical protein [Nostocales cyanobacterium 94392]
MPSASKGRYQSRLFNFFHKQSRRFGEGFGRSLRQLQVATSWSLEALSKSIYLLLQKAVDSAGTQLSPAKQESKFKLQSSEPASDTAIVQILENIETQYIPSLDNSQLSISTTSKTSIVPLTSCSLSNQESEFVEISEQDVCASPTLCEGITITPFSIEDCRNKNRRDKAVRCGGSLRYSNCRAENTEERGKERLVIFEGDRSNQISEEDAISNLKYSSGKIRGIASQLSNQNLVLVTSENEILDILTLSQQQTLQNKIISEIANYWRSWRLSQVKQETKLLSRVESIFKRLAPSNDEKIETLLPITINARVTINPKTLASLDTAVAKLETNALVPVSSAQMFVQQRGGELIKLVRTKLDIFLYGDGDRNLTVSSKQVVATSNSESQKSQIQALISAALNYFYGEPQNKKIKQTPPKRYLSTPKSATPQLQSQQSTDDWLSFNDLFNSGLPQRNQQNQVLNQVQSSKKQLNPSVKVDNPSEKLFGRFKIPNWRTLHLKQKAGLQKQQDGYITKNRQDSYIKKSGQDAHTTGRYQKITISPNSRLQSQNQGEITQTRESTQVEAKPEWIETKAELIGYQKHPLEQILALIDNAMLKIEELFVNFAKALQKLWGK